MSAPTAVEDDFRVVAADSLGSEEGLTARAAGVTASELHDIAQGGRATSLRILHDKLNGATFTGNAHTRRGHEREDFLIDWASENVAHCAGNIALLGHALTAWLLATPDGLGDGFGVEVKSHDFGWDRDDIPGDHYDQCQGGMAVTGYDRWLYVWEVMGEDGTPTLDAPRFLWIERDQKRIARLTREAEAFLAWRASGAPIADDDLPTEVDEALAVIATADEAIAPHNKARDAALKVVRTYAESIADEDGSKGAGLRASFTYSKTPRTVLDEDAWALAEPESYAELVAARAAIAAQEAAALALYHRVEVSTRLNTSRTKGAA